MKENEFLKKFQGRMEQIGRNGYSEIMNNLHINIVDYIPKKPKIIKKPKIKIDPYGHITSEISEEFNKNINFMPQTKNLSFSKKRNKTEEIEKININNIKKIKSIKSININKYNHRNNIENNKNKVKEKEKPVKLLKNLKIDKKNKEDLKPINNIGSRNTSNINDKKYLSIKNNDKLTEPKKRSHSIKLNMKLPKISQLSSIPKNNISNNISNTSNIKLNKSQERTVIFTPQNNNNRNFSSSQKINDNLKKSYNKKVNTEIGNLKNYEIKERYNLPKIEKKKFNKIMNIESDKKIKLYNKQKDEILNNIKNDFLMLDSIKNKVNNIGKSQLIDENSNFKNNNKMNLENKINSYINKNIQKTNNKNFNHSINISNSIDPSNQNNSNNKYSRNLYQNNIYINKNNENYYNSEENIFKINEDKKPHTSFDYPKNVPKLKNKLDIIHEESEEDNNKYITDVIFNNRGEENLNSLEILMKQRAHFQKKIPKDSRFKLK